MEGGEGRREGGEGRREGYESDEGSDVNEGSGGIEGSEGSEATFNLRIGRLGSPGRSSFLPWHAHAGSKITTCIYTCMCMEKRRKRGWKEGRKEGRIDI
jgi:hypothetical protein